MKEKKKCCGSCKFCKCVVPKYYKRGLPLMWVCNNDESKNFGWDMEYMDCCEDYEVRE